MTLKELYFIEHGSCTFRYPKNPTSSDEDQSKSSLSSGLLAALQSFTFETRQGNIDFFASDNEYFMFEMFDQPGIQIVGIFENTTEKQVARSIMSRIKNIIERSELISKPQGLHLTIDKDLALQRKIDQIAQGAISSEVQQQMAKDILDQAEDSAVIVVYNINQSSIIFQETTSYLEKKNISAKQLKRFIRYIDKLVSQIVSGKFEYIAIEVENSVILIVRDQNKLVLTMIEDIEFWEDMDSVYSIPLRLVGYPNYRSYRQEFSSLESAARWKTNSIGNIGQVHGMTPNPSVESLLEKNYEQIQKLIESFDIEGRFHNVNIFIKLSTVYRIRLSRQFTTDQKVIEIYT